MVALGTALLGLDLVALLPLGTWPFVDLPNHLAEATIFKCRRASTLPLHPYYASVGSAEKPSIAHIVLCSLFGSVETGNRLRCSCSVWWSWPGFAREVDGTDTGPPTGRRD